MGIIFWGGTFWSQRRARKRRRPLPRFAEQFEDRTLLSALVFEARVASTSDDAEETASGYVKRTSSDLELTYEAGHQTVGLRFTGVTIPQGATIANAYVQFQVDEKNSGPTSLIVRGQAADDPPSFSYRRRNISSRPTTTAAVEWSPAAWNKIGEAGPAQRTPNLAAVIEEIVGRSGWQGGNSLVLTVTGTGERVAESYNGVRDAAPLLHVEYVLTDVPENVPPVLSPATFTIPENSPAGTTVGTVSADDPDSGQSIRYAITDGNNAGVFDIDSSTGEISVADGSRLDFETTSQYSLTVVATDDGPGTLSDSAAITIDVADVAESVILPEPENHAPVVAPATFTVPENSPAGTSVGTVVADDPDSGQSLRYAITNGNNAGVFGIDPLTGRIKVADGSRLDFEATARYRLVVTATDDGSEPLSGSATITVNVADVYESDTFIVTRRVASASDDAEETYYGSVRLNSPDLELTYDAGHQTVGIRFTNMKIPRGARILDARVQFQADERNSGPTSLVIRGQAADNPPTFGYGRWNISSRTATDAAVEWSPRAWNTVGAARTAQRTPNLAAVVEEIVGRSGWRRGNSLALIVTGTGERVAESYNGVRSAAPRLHVEYTLNSAPVLTPATFTVAENSPQGVVVGTVAATDANAGDTLRFYVAAGNGEGAFAIDASTGQITVNDTGRLDFETTPQYSLTVVVTDDGPVPMSDSATITIDLTDVVEPIDLEGGFFSAAPETLIAGADVDVSFRVANSQPGTAEGFRVDFYLSRDETITTSDRLLGSRAIAGLAPNVDTPTLTETLTLPYEADALWWIDGAYYLGMIVDAGNEVDESNEANNANLGQNVDLAGIAVLGETPAFPGAEGYGATATGGRGGRVIEVTNRNDSGPGSLRAAVEAGGPRTIVFKVGGTITLQSELEIVNPNITIAGQTAPGDGVTLRFAGERKNLLRVSTSNVILRYLRLRRGESGRPGDSLHIQDGSRNVIVDHLSISWATDENLDIYVYEGRPIQDITIQNTLIGPGLDTGNGRAMGALLSGLKDPEYWRLVSRVDLHDNVIANNTHRNPRIITRGTKVVNNLVYNWEFRVGSSERDTVVDWIGNHFISGPMAGEQTEGLLFHATTSQDGSVIYADASIYIAGNIAPDYGFVDPSQDNWAMLKDRWLTQDGEPADVPLRMRRTTPLPDPAIPITVSDPGGDLDALLLADSGASKRLNDDGSWADARDPIDRQIIDDITGGTGPTGDSLPSSAAEASGGYTPAEVDSGYADTDADGMSDVWEAARGLDVGDASDGRADADNDGWTNLEEFLNGTDPATPGQ